MKLKLAFSSLLVLSACATSQDAMQALTAMQILENNKSAGISYEKLSGSGNDVTLTNVSFNAGMDGTSVVPPLPAGTAAGPATMMTAQTMKLNGLTMKEGKPVVRDIIVSGITPAGMPAEAPTIKIGSVGLEGLNEQTGRFVAGAFTKDGPGEMPPVEQWQFKKAAITGISVSGPIPQEEAPAGSLNINLGELSFSNLKDSVLGLTRFAGLAGDINVPGMPPVAGKFDLGTFDVTNFQVGLYAKSMQTMMDSIMTGSTPDIAAALEGWTSPLDPWYDRSTWSGASADMSGLKLNASKMDHVLTRNAEGVVVASHSPRGTVTLTADSNGGTLGAMGLMVLAMAGYPSNVIEIYGSGDATFDPAKDITRWTNYNFGVTDTFDFNISGGLVGLQASLPGLLNSMVSGISMMTAAMPTGEEGEVPEIDPEALQSAATGMAMTMVMSMIGLQVTDLDIAITDKALVNFILQQTAAESGASVAAFREDLANMVGAAAADITAVGIDAELANELTTALAGFLRGPGTLRLQLKPKAPLGLMNLMMVPPTKESLGFSATFTPAG